MYGVIGQQSTGVVMKFFTVLVPAFLLLCGGRVEAQTAIAAGDFRLTLDTAGQVTGLDDLVHGVNYAAPGVSAPFLTIRRDGRSFPASRMRVLSKELLRFEFDGGSARLDVAARSRAGYVTFEIVDAVPVGEIDAAIWGPYPTSIGKTVGEVVGVVRDDRFALGIQALNPKTIGSYPGNAEGFEMSRGKAAEPRAFGSVLQCYSLNRSRVRRADVWLGNFPDMPVPPIPGETVSGSKIALFGCAEPEALDRIGEIEIGEGLPHPVVDGVWIKKSPQQGRSYLISDFDETTFDELLSAAVRANLMTLYHMQPFASWGHYEINTKIFPGGAADIRRLVEKAKAAGVRLGAHTLTTFIQTNDPYVTPVPDPRLALTGSSALASDVDTAATEIEVASPEYFSNEKANWVHAAVIGTEIIRYRTVSGRAPWTLVDCERGAFGTRVQGHRKGDSIGKLLDHDYKVFFPNFELQREIAGNLARTFNETGLSQMDFDGHEGTASTGQGDFAYESFPLDFTNGLDHVVLNGTSNSKHFYWHINTYCNWGEPWSEGFRESMQEYRISNQALFSRNYMPNMLGWYLLTETTTLSDAEWMLARAAGFNAGFALATNIDAVRKNPSTGAILDAIREWEAARRSGAFPPGVRSAMRDPKTEFHLEPHPGGGWNLYAYHDSPPFRHEKNVRQPGEPTGARWEVLNPDSAQLLQFTLRVPGDSGSVANPSLEIDRYGTLTFRVVLAAGQTLVCEGARSARVCDNRGRQIATVQASGRVPALSAGTHEIRFDCEFAGGAPPPAVVVFKTRGGAERIGIPSR
jgi:hypothetical protein